MKPRRPCVWSVRLAIVAYATGSDDVWRIHFTRWMGCLAKVAQKPETVPEHQVICALVRSCFRRGGGAAIAPSTALQAFWRGGARRRESVESFAANSYRRAPRNARVSLASTVVYTFLVFKEPQQCR